MERSSTSKTKTFKATVVAAAALGLAGVILSEGVGFAGTSSAGASGVILAQPEEPARQDPTQGPVEQFPESRFGMPPMRIGTGIINGYASRAVIEMETSDEADAQPVGGSRSPAGLDFGKGAENQRKIHTAPPARNLAPPEEPGRTPDSALVAGRTRNAESESVIELPSPTVIRRGVQEVAVIASDLGFFPKTVFVARDVPVRLFVTGASKNTLCIMMDSFQVRKQVRSQKIEEITFTPATPGKFRFYCPVNGMEGTLIVKELTTDAIARVTASDAVGK